MADYPYMKWWVVDYFGDTRHLTVQEHGAYMVLLGLAWQTPGCSLPDDAHWIKRRLRVTDEEYAEFVRPVIDEFWTKEDHRIYQKRQREEWFEAQHRREMAKKAANKLHHGEKVIPLKKKEED